MSEDEKNKKQFHKLTESKKKLLLGILIFLSLTLIPFLGYSYYQFALNRPAQGLQEAEFKINEGESVSSIANRLLENELINSEFLFKVYLLTEGLHTKIEAGVYKIPAGVSVKKLAEIFQHGTNDLRVTLLEGLRVEEYASYLSSKEGFDDIDYNEFLDLAKDKEGYLFPDTYFFNVGVTEQDIIDRLLQNYNLKIQKIITDDGLKRLGMTEEEVIIFASIVEREISREEDKPIVAGILIDRWKNNYPLEADATTQYAVAIKNFCDSNSVVDGDCPAEQQVELIDWWPENLSQKDLDFDSPYNTRKNIGLPPKPICNPGLSSIKSVMNYKDTTYNFYLTDKNGITHFANTLQEHNRNVSEYLY